MPFRLKILIREIQSDKFDSIRSALGLVWVRLAVSLWQTRILVREIQFDQFDTLLAFPARNEERVRSPRNTDD